jgi:hypothetical protein
MLRREVPHRGRRSAFNERVGVAAIDDPDDRKSFGGVDGCRTDAEPESGFHCVRGRLRLSPP